MRNLIFPALLLALGCGGSPSSGDVTHDYVFNTVDGQFHDNTLVDGKLVAANVISDTKYDEESHSQLLSSDLRFRAECAGTCQPEPGDYTLEFAIVSDSCELGVLPTEIVSIGADGLSPSSIPASPEGCVDDVQSAGLTASVTRHCATTASGHTGTVYGRPASVSSNGAVGVDLKEVMGHIVVKDVTMHLDFAQHSGTASVLEYTPGDAARAWCASSQRVRIESWN
jgi:hypothetical protein